jgi:anti-anti-sigma regulatory factor
MYFDIPQFEELRDELAEFVHNFRPRKLLVNFTHVRYCSMAIINSLLVVKGRIESYGGEMKCCGMNRAVRDSFAMLQLDGPVFEIHSTAAGALADCSR